MQLLPDRSSSIVSPSIEIPTLSLPAEGGESTLNMADRRTLRGFLEFAVARAPSDHQAVVLWGHGGVGECEDPRKEGRMGIFDEGTGDTLTTSDVGEAFRGMGVDIVVLDLCYGSRLEVAFELSHATRYIVASQGIVPRDGFPYREILVDAFLLPPRAAGERIVAAYSERYAQTSCANVALVDGESIDSVAFGFDHLIGEHTPAV